MVRNLRAGLDRDVYQVLTKLEDANEQTFKTVTQVYEAIKRSNSHLSRQKKRPLEDAIDRVLQFRKDELEDSEDSEAFIEAEESKLPEERSLLNRQMTKHWNVAPTPQQKDTERPSKKRRVREEGGSQEERDTQPKTSGDTPGARPNGVIREETAGEKSDRGSTQKKTPRPSRHQVERISKPEALGGLGEFRDELSTLVGATLKYNQIWSEKRWKHTTGLILSGPSGVGKKSLVRSVAAELEVPLVSLASCLLEQERMEKSLVEAIDEAMRLAPSILFIENIDKYTPKPGSTGHSEHHERTVDLLKRQIQRLRQEAQHGQPVFPIATTSNITDVHPAMTSCFWFEKTLQMRVPDSKARKEIFEVILNDTDKSDDIDCAELARLTHGFVGADIEIITHEAQMRAATRIIREPIEQADTAMTDDDKAEPQPMVQHTVTSDDFREVIKDYIPSLRKEGFTVIPSVNWDQVGALTAVREQLNMSIIGPIKNPDLYEGWGLKRPAGVMLWGPPGCGKTLVAQAVANEAQASFILINGPELLNKYVGESERAVRELFQRARSSTPCILFFDEMDSLVPRRDGASSDAGVRVVNALLTELDGVQDRSGIYVIGTTNRPDMIDAAMLRPGRLSIRIFIDLPTEDERVDILRTIFRSNHRNPSETEMALLEGVARDRRCHDFSGADLGGLRIRAAENGLRRYLRKEKTVQEIDAEDWEHALDNTTRSVMNPQSYRSLDSKLGKEK